MWICPSLYPLMYHMLLGCGNGCQASTVHPHRYHRHTLVPLDNDFAAIMHLPSVVQDVLVHVCLADPVRVPFCLLSLAVNLLAGSCSPPTPRPLQHYWQQYWQYSTFQVKLGVFTKIFCACTMFEVVMTAFEVVQPTFNLSKAPPLDQMLHFCNSAAL